MIDPDSAGASDAPVLFQDHGNPCDRRSTRWPTDPGALEDAEVVIRARFVNQRLAPAPMEPNGALAIAHGPDSIGNAVGVCRHTFASRKTVARILGLEESKVRVIAPKVGGGFGAKIPTYAEQVQARAARPGIWTTAVR